MDNVLKKNSWILSYSLGLLSMSFLSDLKAIFTPSTRLVTNFLGSRHVVIDLNVRDVHGVMDVYQFTANNVINLCGGIPSDKVGKVVVRIESVGHAILQVEIVTDLYSMSRSIFLEDRVIINNAFELPKHNTRGKGVGTYALINQVLAASAKKFEKIELLARGGINNKIKHSHNGHYTWGRLGFEMMEDDKIRFRGTMIDLERDEKTLQELLSSEDGRRLWKYEGHEWNAYFDLSQNSECMKRLNSYLIEKGIRKAV